MNRMTAFLCVLLGGCSAYGLARPAAAPISALNAPPSGQAQICVLRPHWIAGAVTMLVRDNDLLVGATRGTSYFCYFAEPGHHHIASIADSTEVAEIDVAMGERHYLHQIVDNIAGFVRGRLAWVSTEAAPELVEKCEYKVLVSVPGTEKLPDNPPIAPGRRSSAAR